jgi:hypothetical protein
LSDLQRIPGVGPSIEQDFLGLGISSVADLVGQDPEALFERLCMERGERIDRCVLYVFRSSIYFASESERRHEEPLLLWWNWKDESLVARAAAEGWF